MNAHDVIHRPLVTEKSNIGREEANLATFAVNPRANKHEIQRAVEELFEFLRGQVGLRSRPGRDLAHLAFQVAADIRLDVDRHGEVIGDLRPAALPGSQPPVIPQPRGAEDAP